MRQAQHLAFLGQAAYLPVGPVSVLTVPDPDNDRTLATRPVKARMWHKQRSGLDWQVSDAVDQGWPVVTRAFQYARRVMAVALPHNGELWSGLHPAAGGDPIAAHMSTVLLALWIYETHPRFTQNAAAVEELTFPGIGDGMVPWHSNAQLVNVRPAVIVGTQQVSALRATDLERLENADQGAVSTWAHCSYLALRTANNVIHEHRDPLSKSNGVARLRDLTTVVHASALPDERSWNHELVR
ncbi:hypothetical protein [Streptomyces sp. NPDC002851]